MLASFLKALTLIITLTSCQVSVTKMSYEGAAPIVNNQVTAHGRITKRFGLGPIKSQINSYDGKGQLAASWTPSSKLTESITFVILHGGHGIGATVWWQARELRERFNANVLVLDSFWSRGSKRNRERGANKDAIVRTFDVIAAGRWLVEKGSNPKRTYLLGGSQGGWTTLKAMTAEPLQIKEVKPLYAGGIALYPVCDNYQRDGQLRWGSRYVNIAEGGYWGPVMIMTGDKDFATRIEECPLKVIENATNHTRYVRGTHGWNARWFDKKTKKWNITGSCLEGDKFTMCYDEAHTNDMYKKIGKFSKIIMSK